MARIRTVALGAALFAATIGSAAAQAQGTPRTESAMKGGHHGRHGEGKRMRGMRGKKGRSGVDFLRDLNLTETQRTQIRAIHEKYEPQMKAIRERARSDFAAAREARQRGDSAAARAALQRSRDSIGTQAASLHEQMFREVRAVLTADQRAKVDAGIAARIKKLDEEKERLERLRR